MSTLKCSQEGNNLLRDQFLEVRFADIERRVESRLVELERRLSKQESVLINPQWNVSGQEQVKDMKSTALLINRAACPQSGSELKEMLELGSHDMESADLENVPQERQTSATEQYRSRAFLPLYSVDQMLTGPATLAQNSSVDS